MPLFLTLLTVVFAPLIEGGTTHLPVFILRILVLLTFALWLKDGLKKGALSLFRSRMDIAVLVFFAAAVISTVTAPYKSMALTWVQLILYYALFFYLAGAALAAPNSIRDALYLIIGMGAFESAVGILQWFSSEGRPTGTFFNPNMLAGYVAPALLVSISLIVFNHKLSASRTGKAALAAVSAICIAAITMTGSRGGALAFCVGLFVVLWIRSRRFALIATAALTLIVLTVPNPVKERIHSNDPVAYSRAGIWKSAARMMSDHPLGVGLGNFKYAWSGYNFPVKEDVIKYGKVANTAHSEYLQAGAEMGFLGLAAFLIGVALLAVTTAGSVQSAAKNDKAIAAGLAGGVTAVLTHSIVDSNLHEPGIVFMTILMICMALNASKREGDGIKYLKVEGTAKTRYKALSAVLLVLLLAWASSVFFAHRYSQEAADAYRSGYTSEARGLADKAILLDPGNAAYHSLRASILHGIYKGGGSEDMLKDSLDELDQAERLNPIDRAYPMLKENVTSAAAAGQKDPAARKAMFARALDDVARARALDPYGADILYEQARLNYELGNLKLAVLTLEELKRLEPNSLRGRFFLAQLYMRAGKLEPAKAECRDIIKIHDDLQRYQLTGQDKQFVVIDIAAVKGALDSMEGRRG